MKPFISTLVLAATLAAGQASADEGELQPIVMPAVSLLPRGHQLNTGLAATLGARWGLRDWLAVEATLTCDRFDSVKDHWDTGNAYYDAVRCAAAPGIAFRWGARFVTSGALAAGYRFEKQSNRDAYSKNNVFVRHLPSTTQHALVGRASLGLEYRLLDKVSVGAVTTATLPLVGVEHRADFTAGVLASTYLYP